MDIDFTFKWLNFILLAVVLFFVLRRPLREFFSSRALLIRSQVSQAKELYQKAMEESGSIHYKLKNLEEEARQLSASLQKEGEQEKQKLVDQAGRLARRMEEDSKKIADMEIKKAKEELREVAVGLACAIAERKVRQELAERDEERLTQGFLDRMRRLH